MTAAMQIYRTPDERFARLPGYVFAPHYVDVGGVRMHYVDTGPRRGPAVVLLHGEPTWSYLYRTMIDGFVEAGYRVLAPDLIGFGRSDKPGAVVDYSYQHHMDWTGAWLDAVGVDGMTLFCQDWGALIGLRLVAAQPERFARVVVGNGFLPTGDERVPPVFRLWQAFARYAPVFPIGAIMQVGCKRHLDAATRAAYTAPFPDARYMAGARALPALVPTTPDNPASQPNRDAWTVLECFDKPFHTAFSDGDPVTRGADRPLRRRIPGAKDAAHTTIKGARHFLQEDQGEAIVAFMLAQIGRA